MKKKLESRIDELMTTNLITIDDLAPLERAQATLTENGIRHLPVVDSEGRVIGIISDRDLLRASVPSVSGFETRAGSLRFVSGSTVGEYMSTALKVIPDSGDIQVAIELMLREKISSCLVVNGNEVVGIITYEDLLDLLKAYLSKPAGSLRSTIGAFVAKSPLGAVSSVLSNSGI